MAFLDFDYQDQDHNWSGTSQAPAANNTDKEIETHFVTLGVQYLFNPSWGVQAEVPYDFRKFKTDIGGGTIVTKNWSQLGDIRLKGIYTGFLPDLSAGLTFGLKLPTGSYSYAPDVVDRDTQIGTGSTDFLLGGFFRHNIDKYQQWDCFAQFELDVPALIQAGYRPGTELDTAAGVDYKGLSVGRLHISPVAQMIFSERTGDIGPSAHSDQTGYQRIMLSPGVEFHIHPVKLYADAEFPVYQNFTGNQVAASVLFKVSLSYMF